MRKRKLKCFNCQHMLEVETYDEVNYDFDLLLNGLMFATTCDNCQKQNFFDYPLVVKHSEMTIAYKKELLDADRLVMSQNDLIEKAHILLYEKDDRVIELMKARIKQNLFKKDVNPIIHFLQADEDFLEFRIVIDKKFDLITQSIHAYNEYFDWMMPMIEKLSENTKVIDTHWANEHLDQLLKVVQHKNKH